MNILGPTGGATQQRATTRVAPTTLRMNEAVIRTVYGRGDPCGRPRVTSGALEDAVHSHLRGGDPPRHPEPHGPQGAPGPPPGPMGHAEPHNPPRRHHP